ncbi:DgyrCDS14872 [Dimorphilus gyrociliatus]|uniref:DgyrCDS14872 n=1 Tax=Dimorphilus gyrociliatus TaxID=2664684 RepID=A0A7I8WFG8_9ANNE|nr:DgyrCDS14872 [Dimorphilus gyrociliatus]
MMFKLTMIFSIVILEIFFSNRIFTSGEKFANGKLINVAGKMNNATCTSSNDHASNVLLNFHRENIMDPFWVNINDWVAKCDPDPCHLQWINITFQKQYDIVEICVYQRIIKATNRINKLTIRMDNQNKTYLLNDIQTCLLLDEDFGSKSSSIRLSLAESRSVIPNIGIGYISALAYNNDQDSLEYEDYENIAQQEMGATCSSSSSIPLNECKNALDWTFNTYWKADCPSIINCVGQYISVTFTRTTEPEKICLANV